MKMKNIFKNVILIITFPLIFSCNKHYIDIFSDTLPSLAETQIPLYHTWNSLNEMEYRRMSSVSAEENLSSGFIPWAGIVSHHILAHVYIDAWFSQLAKLRNIKTFFIISPDHYGLSLLPYSLTVGSWDSGFGFVESDRNNVLQLAKSLDVELDPNVFIYEHGISSLMPYIKKYFPNAEIAAIIISGESEVNTRTAGQLAGVLEKMFDESGKKNNFLLISSDFSHNGNINETEFNDDQSLQYLKNTDGAFWNMVICDNRFGIYILDRLGKNKLDSCIPYHTNSFEISGVDYDITSYFFVYFADKK